MRSLFGSLTARGRAFLSAGATALVSAFVLGLDDLARVAVLLVALPLLSALLLRRFQHRLGLSRRVEPATVEVGQHATVRLRMSSEGATVGGIVSLEEQVPYTLGGRPRFVLDPAAGRWAREVAYRVRPEVRGHYTLGPMAVRVSDPFGMAELARSFTSHSDLIVTPAVEPLPPIALSGAWTGTGDNRPRAFAGGSAEDVTIREYRRGDDLRRVHWRSSARTGELMVRREEQPWQSRATVVIDNRRRAHRGQGPTASFERAVTVAASVALHLVARGYRVRLVTADPGDIGSIRAQQWHEHGVSTTEAASLLESLALLSLSDRLRIDTSWLGGTQQGGVVVAVLGECSTTDEPALRHLQHAGDHSLAVQLAVTQWGASTTRVSPASRGAAPVDPAWLRARGWRATELGATDDLGEAWRSLGTSRAQRTPTTATGAR